MNIRALLFLTAVLPCAAQDLRDLATTGDGSVAYFATALPRKGTGEPAWTRIYGIGAGGMQLVLERAPDIPPFPAVRGQIAFTNYFTLSHPQASRDGQIVAIVGARQCMGGDFCVQQTSLQTTVTGRPGGAVDVPGAGRLSGNGRYLLIYGYGSIASYGGAVVDLDTGRTTPWNAPVAYALGAGRVIADNGTAVVAAGQLAIARGASVIEARIPAGNPAEAVIDAVGENVVYSLTSYDPARTSLHVYRIASEQDSELVTLAGASSYSPYLSADGKRVLFLAGASEAPQLYAINTDGSGLRQVSHEPSGVTAAAMSDDGKVAWYFSGAARLHQLNLDTGDARERMGRTPQLGFRTRMAAGSAYTIAGWGFSDAAFAAASYPLPRSLGGISVRVNGVAAPLYSVEPTRIVLQVPWGTPFDTRIEVETAASGLFDPVTNFANQTLSGYGLFVPVSSRSGYGGWDSLAIHGDWSGQVTAANPARPGEIIHLYGTGFGPVDRAQTDGTPAPGNPPAKTVAPVTCWAWGADNLTRLDIPVLFSGLAPGMAGYYQLDVRMPPGNLRPSIQLACTGDGYNADFFAAFETAAR